MCRAGNADIQEPEAGLPAEARLVTIGRLCFKKQEKEMSGLYKEILVKVKGNSLVELILVLAL